MWLELTKEYATSTDVVLIDHDRDTNAGRAFADKYEFISQPGFVVLDANGKLLSKGYGPYTGPELRALVARVAAE